MKILVSGCQAIKVRCQVFTVPTGSQLTEIDIDIRKISILIPESMLVRVDGQWVRIENKEDFVKITNYWESMYND